MPKLLDSVRRLSRLRHHSRRTEQAYVFWIKRYIHFHGCATPPNSATKRSPHFSRTWPPSAASRPPHRIRPSRPFSSSTGTCSGYNSPGSMSLSARPARATSPSSSRPPRCGGCSHT